jgi:hypothetical protein
VYVCTYHLFFDHFLAPDVPQPIKEACEVISRVRVGFRIKHHWMHICSVLGMVIFVWEGIGWQLVDLLFYVGLTRWA